MCPCTAQRSISNVLSAAWQHCQCAKLSIPSTTPTAEAAGSLAWYIFAGAPAAGPHPLPGKLAPLLMLPPVEDKLSMAGGSSWLLRELLLLLCSCRKGLRAAFNSDSPTLVNLHSMHGGKTW